MTHTPLRIAIAGLVAGPLCFTLADTLRRTVDSGTGGDPVALTQAVSAHPGAWLSAALLNVLATIVFLPGVVGLVLTARGRGAALTRVGGGLLGLGLVASVGHAVAYFGPFATYGDAGTSPAAIRALDSASEGYPMLTGLILLFIAGMMLGTLLLMVGLRRGGLVPIWSVVAGLVFVVLASSSGVVWGVVEVVAALAAFAPAARTLSGNCDTRGNRDTRLSTSPILPHVSQVGSAGSPAERGGVSADGGRGRAPGARPTATDLDQNKNVF